MPGAAPSMTAATGSPPNTRRRSRTDVNVMSCTVCETIDKFRVLPSGTLSAAGVIVKLTRSPSSSRTAAAAEALPATTS